jgi:hypothetical protein
LSTRVDTFDFFASEAPLGYEAGDANLYRYVSNSPTLFIDPRGLQEFPLVKWNGDTWEAIVEATGTVKGDTRGADKILRDIDPKFPGAKSLDATWHHKSFNEKTGMFTMELVDLEAHAAKGHKGAFAKYLDWAADTLKTGKVADLSDDLLNAVLKTLVSKELGSRVDSRLADSTTDFIVKKLKNNGYRVLITESGEVTTELVGKRAGRSLVGTVVRRGGAALPGVFVVLAAGEAFAETGEVKDAAVAGMREMVLADFGEAGFQLTVVQGSKALDKHVIDLQRGLGGRKWATLPEDMRREKLKEIEDTIRNTKTITEIFEEQKRDREKKGETFWGMMKKIWNDGPTAQ